MIKETQLTKMSLKELVTLQGRIEKVIASRQEAEKADLKNKISKMAQASGFDVNDLFGGKAGKKRGTVAVKFRDPKNAANTWTGRGRMPRWLAAKVKSGQKKERFLIK